MFDILVIIFMLAVIAAVIFWGFGALADLFGDLVHGYFNFREKRFEADIFYQQAFFFFVQIAIVVLAIMTAVFLILIPSSLSYILAGKVIAIIVAIMISASVIGAVFSAPDRS